MRTAAVLIVLAAACGSPPADGFPQPVAGGRQPAVVTRHVDGDTLWVRARGDGPLPQAQEHKIRLLEIDTPEVADGGGAGECYGAEAAAFTAGVLPLGAEVALEADRADTDQYGRYLRYLWSADGELVNAEIVRQGFARAVLYQPNDAHIERIRAAEAEARGAGRGLWGACPADTG